MDVLLALLALFNVLSMVAVFVPRTFPDNMAPWIVFAFALLATELAWLWLPVQAVLALVFVTGGALQSALGAFSLAVLAASWLGLAWSIRVGLQTGPVVEAALTQELGPDYRATIPTAVSRGFRHVVRFADWRRPFTMPVPGVQVTRNIAYVEGGGVRQRLDIYRPVNVPPEGCPVLLQIHGGAWMIGAKEEQALPLMYRMASHGWICVAANYRLSPSVGFPKHLEDCKAALAWIRSKGREYGMDPSFVAVTGGSAGGHLSALMGLTENRPELQPGFADVDTSVQACVPFYGVYDFLNRSGARPRSEKFVEFLGERVVHARPEENPALWDLASPITQIHADVPPFMVIHGALDSLAPVADARLFVRRLREVSRNPVVYLEVPGAEHAFEIMHSPRTEHTIDGVQRFLEWVRARSTRT
jgi:acetyl esterase/lipase